MDFSPNDLYARGFELQAQERYEEAQCLFAAATKMRPEDAGGFSLLGSAARLAGNTETALAAFSTCLSLDPENAAARHMLAALNGETPGRADAGYVRELFDAYAETFDSHLKHALSYRTPHAIADAIAHVRGQTGISNRIIPAALDLGCGTGLAAEALKGQVGRFYGVDLSANMIRKAKGRALYHGLYQADVEDFLREPPRTLPAPGLVCAVDVFPYFGNLRDVFKGIRERLDENGLFAFSIERMAPGSYGLQPSGRFAHAPGYIGRLADETGFDVALKRTSALRSDRDGPLDGLIYVLRRRQGKMSF